MVASLTLVVRCVYVCLVWYPINQSAPNGSSVGTAGFPVIDFLYIVCTAGARKYEPCRVSGHQRSQKRNGHVQKLKANTQKRMDDLQNPKNASNKKLDKGIDLSLSVEDIMQRMDQLKEKVVVEQDQAERERIITRIQALNSAWMELTGENDSAAASDAKASGKDLATTLKEDLAKYTTQLKEMQAQEDAQRDEVEDMREKMNASQPVIDRLRQEREVCLTVVRSLWDKTKAINEEYSGMFDSYKEELKEWNARMDVIMADRCGIPGLCVIFALQLLKALMCSSVLAACPRPASPVASSCDYPRGTCMYEHGDS